MRVIFDHDRCTLFHGDSSLLDLPPNSIDSIVCDPPSGTSFMNKTWDTDHGGRDAWIDWLANVLAPAYRALKPGGHAVFWALPRTSHWTAMALEKVGFEIRDRVSHIFLSGFPKNLDVAKQVDKSDAASERRRRALAFTAWIRSTGLTSARINEITGTSMGSHYVTEGEQPQIATREILEQLRPFVPSVPDEIEELVGHREVLSEQFAKREVIGTEIMPDATKVRLGFVGATYSDDPTATREVNITAPYTEAAQKWDGWGTALKPAMEDWWLVRKPLEDTVAANILEHGVGAINIDASRVGEKWPAHLVVDEGVEINDVETPAKYFYCPKPPKSETEAGLAHLPVVSGADLLGREADSAGLKNPRAGAGRTAGARNIHPTKKPVDLMTYLIRLITPPGGVVLDPFAGSGTTGVAALAGGWSFVGCEQGGEHNAYLPILVGRIRHALGMEPEPFDPVAR